MLKDFHKKWQTSPIEALQDSLCFLGYSGMVIPHKDSIQNVGISHQSHGLQAVFGFEGSAGLGILLGKRAALFLDGRYILEGQSLRSKEVEIYLWTLENIKAFLTSMKQPQETIILGYDPHLLTQKSFEDFKILTDQVGIQLKVLDPNPIDTLSQITSPHELSNAPPFIYLYAQDHSFQNKCQVLAQELVQKGLKAFFVSAPENLNWLLNLRGSDLPYTPLFLATGILYDTAEVDVFSQSLIPEEIKNYYGSQVRFFPLRDLRSRLNSIFGSIGADPMSISRAIGGFLEEGEEKTKKIMWAPDPCILAKSVRTREEALQVAQAHHRDGAALVSVFKDLLDPRQDHSFLTESLLAEKIDNARKGLENYVSPSFKTIVGFGPNGAIIHYHPKSQTDRTLGGQELVLMDSGGQYLDGTTDVTRTLWVGDQNPPDVMRQAYTLVLKGHIALSRIKFPKGTTGGHLDSLARQFLWDKGLDYAHGTGHGVGHFMNVHEGPQGISQRSFSVPLLPGMLVSNEPGYYLEGAFGIRLENLMIVVPSPKENFYEFKTLTQVPYQKCLIDLENLTPVEIDWINAYHNSLQEALKPLVSTEVYLWLKDQTSPL